MNPEPTLTDPLVLIERMLIYYDGPYPCQYSENSGQLWDKCVCRECVSRKLKGMIENKENK